MKITQCLLLTLLCIAFIQVQSQQLVVYPAPQNAPATLKNNDFEVKVRKPGGQWQELFEYNVKVDEVKEATHTVRDASMCSFDLLGEVEVSVTSNKEKIHSARIRPLASGVKYVIRGNTIYFRISQPAKLSIEINGDIFHNLHLFANPVDDFIYDKKDTNVIYFGPGIHDIGKMKSVSSGKTVYIAGGAVLMGQLVVDHVRDIKILGRGLIDISVKAGISIRYSKNVLVDGICLTQCPTGGSDSVTIRNVKVFSYYSWGDGLNVFASNNVTFDDVFCRTSDDCTTVYGTRKRFVGGCNNITMQNSTLWADVAHPILIGSHGNTKHPDTLQNILYKNIDILDHKEMQLDYQGCMSINAGDNNFIRNVRFENIRVEDFRQGQLVNLRVYYNRKYNTSPGRGIENIFFNNIFYTGSHAEPSIISGYDEDRKIKNVVFENLQINGVLIYDGMASKPAWYGTSDMARFIIGEHVEGVIFKK